MSESMVCARCREPHRDQEQGLSPHLCAACDERVHRRGFEEIPRPRLYTQQDAAILAQRDKDIARLSRENARLREEISEARDLLKVAEERATFAYEKLYPPREH